MGKVRKHFVEIEYQREKTKVIYRFFGLGEWKVKDGRRWRTVNAIYVPGDALSVAAAYCQPEPPILTEVEIARLCGGRAIRKVSPHGR